MMNEERGFPKATLTLSRSLAPFDPSTSDLVNILSRWCPECRTEGRVDCYDFCDGKANLAEYRCEKCGFASKDDKDWMNWERQPEDWLVYDEEDGW